MAYESPIGVWWSDTKIEQLRDEYDNLIVKAVKNVCPNVDKDELIKALQYDRGQYEKGFADGIAFEPPVKTQGDSIRAMSDEELAEWIDEFWSAAWCPDEPPVDPETKQCLLHDGDCRLCILDWLRQEVSD